MLSLIYYLEIKQFEYCRCKAAGSNKELKHPAFLDLTNQHQLKSN